MAGIKGKTGNPGQRRHWAGPGRKPTRATIQEGMIVMISYVGSDGHADLGRGIVSEVERKKGADRCVIVSQADGSELRIIIGENT